MSAINELEINLPKTANLTAILYKEDDMYVAKCPETGTVSQGYSVEEALNNLREPTELYLEDEPALQAELSSLGTPIITTFEARLA